VGIQNSIYHGRRIRCRPTGTPRRLTVIARTDARLAVVRAKPLNGLLEKHPELWCRLAVVIGTILRSLQDAGVISIGYGKIRPLQPEEPARARRSGVRLERVMGIEPM